MITHVLRQSNAVIHEGDCNKSLTQMPSELFQTVITSPPYWKQRDYDNSNQLGQEQTPEGYIDKMLLVFKKVHRVLRDDGTLWLNIGDTYLNKQLCGIPWRLALAMQADGWILRSDIIWNKTSAIPSGGKDRPVWSHEYIFLFSKQKEYFYDYMATLEKASSCESKLKRSVWDVAYLGEKEQHYAAFPPKLIRPCIKAGSSKKGACVDCGAPWKRMVKEERIPTRPGTNSKRQALEENTKVKGDAQRHITIRKTLGWVPSCTCTTDAPPEPCIVLDPFGGTMTTIAESVRLGRAGVACELNPDYVKMGVKKIKRFGKKRGFGITG